MVSIALVCGASSWLLFLADIPPGLRVLCLHHLSIRALFGKLGKLHELQELDLSYCENIGDLTFDAIAIAMLSKLTKLCLLDTAFSDAHAARIFPQMYSLRVLDVIDCDDISVGLWHVLPPALTVLHATNAVLGSDAGGNNGHKTLGELFVASPVLSRLKDLKPLENGFVGLEVLNLSHSFPLGGACVSDALNGMPLLVELDLSFCAVGVPTFNAIARLLALTKLVLSRTAFSDANATYALPKLHALRHLDVTFCKAVSAGLWETLPSALTVLCANGTKILDGEVDNRSIPKGLRNLHARAWQPGLRQFRKMKTSLKTNLAALAPAFGPLRYLDVGGWIIESCAVSDG